MNIADKISQIAQQFPEKTSVILPEKKGKEYIYHGITFSQLEKKINSYCYFLKEKGLKKDQKTLLFVKPSLEFHALVFSLFKMGVTPILIDPGMGLKNLKIAVKEARPDMMIAEPIVFFLKAIFRDAFSSLKRGLSTRDLKKCKHSDQTYPSRTAKHAAILFTSGGTGRPKGVVYTHKIFDTQTKILQEMFNLSAKEVDLPGFPLFSLFTLSMGMTSVIPDMDASKPKKAAPEKLVKNINDNQATFLAGSPAIWENVLNYCKENMLTLPSVKYLVMFGAPVRNYIHEGFKDILPNGTTYTPYGATESLPVANISGRIILNETAHMTDLGFGTCVGEPAPGIKIKIVEIQDGEIKNLQNVKELPPGEIGEIIVQGDVVTREYLNAEKETNLAKIKDGETFWHRIGDMGYFDSAGRLWFCGRKAHRIELENGTLLCPIPCEAIFNQHQAVSKTALIIFKNHPAIVVERKTPKEDKGKLRMELLKLGSEHPHTEIIKDIYFCDKFPVDIRHNIKIDRLKLRDMAEEGKL